MTPSSPTAPNPIIIANPQIVVAGKKSQNPLTALAHNSLAQTVNSHAGYGESKRTPVTLLPVNPLATIYQPTQVPFTVTIYENKEVKQTHKVADIKDWQLQLKELVLALRKSTDPHVHNSIFNKITAFIKDNQSFTQTRKGIDYLRVCEGFYILVEAVKDCSTQAKDIVRLAEDAIPHSFSSHLERLPFNVAEQVMTMLLPSQESKDPNFSFLNLIIENPFNDEEVAGDMLANWINQQPPHTRHWREAHAITALRDINLQFMVIDHLLPYSSLLTNLSIDAPMRYNKHHGWKFELNFCRSLVRINPGAGYELMAQALARSPLPDLEALDPGEKRAILQHAEVIDTLNWNLNAGEIDSVYVYTISSETFTYGCEIIKVLIGRDRKKGLNLLAKNLPFLARNPSFFGTNIVEEIVEEFLDSVRFAKYEAGSAAIMRRIIDLSAGRAYSLLAGNLNQNFKTFEFTDNDIRALSNFSDEIPIDISVSLPTFVRRMVTLVPAVGYKLLARDFSNTSLIKSLELSDSDIIGVFEFSDHLPEDLPFVQHSLWKRIINLVPTSSSYRLLARNFANACGGSYSEEGTGFSDQEILKALEFFDEMRFLEILSVSTWKKIIRVDSDKGYTLLARHFTIAYRLELSDDEMIRALEFFKEIPLPANKVGLTMWRRIFTLDAEKGYKLLAGNFEMAHRLNLSSKEINRSLEFIDDLSKRPIENLSSEMLQKINALALIKA